MVGFKNRYMVMEVFLNPNRDRKGDDPIIITQFNVSKAIKDSILVNFGECGLASSLGSFLVKYVNPITNMCIIRASREDYQKVWSAITMVRSIGNYPVIFNLLDLSVYPSPASASIFQQPSDIPVASYRWQVCGVLFAGGQFLPCCYVRTIPLFLFLVSVCCELTFNSFWCFPFQPQVVKFLFERLDSLSTQHGRCWR